MKRSSVFLFLLMSIWVFSQDIDAYNKVYNRTFLKTAQTDFPAALKTADSLYAISETPVFQTKSLILYANLYFQKGNVEKAVEFALKAKNIIEPTEDYLTQGKVYGFLSSLYMDLNFYKQSKEYFNKCVEVTDKIEDRTIANNMKGVIFQQRAQSENKFKHYHQSIASVKESQKYFNLLKNPQPFNLCYNEQILGQNYYSLKKPEQAVVHFNKALEIANAIPDTYLIGFTYSSLAMIYIDKKDVINAKKYLTSAQQIADRSQFLELKKQVNETADKYYKLTNDVKKLVEIQNKQDVVIEKLQTQKDAFVEKSIVDLKNENVVVKEKISTGKIIILVCIACLIFAFLYFILSRRNHRKDFENFQKIMADLHSKMLEQEKQIQDNSELKEELIESKETSKIPEKIMIDSTELKLLKKLEKFENSTLFTKNTISLSTLSTYCETNSRYLSHVINTHKQKDFSNYISELRINYIIEKLERVPKYRKYKISALAEESGFSSPNKLAMVFKKVTHISPSVFIRYLEENGENETRQSVN